MNDRVVAIIAAVVAVALQVLVAPHIAVGSGMPNFIAVFAIVMGIMRPGYFKHVLPFVLGLVYDLWSGGPVGSMAFTLTAVCAWSSWFFQRANNDSLFMGMLVMAIGLMLVEVVWGSFLLLFGFSANLLEAFAFRALPCFAYDLVVGVIVYLLATRFFTHSAPLRSEITQLH